MAKAAGKRLLPPPSTETWMLIDSGLGRLHWTRRCETLGESLALMRREMMQSMRLSAAVFVGGGWRAKKTNMNSALNCYRTFPRYRSQVRDVLLRDCRWPMCASWALTRNWCGSHATRSSRLGS